MIRCAAALLLLSPVSPSAALQANPNPEARENSALAAALRAPTRTPANVARDRYRHPGETLAFFGVRPSDKVVELWPGGGWYTEILGPYLSTTGNLILVPPTGNGEQRIRSKLASNPVYGAVQVAPFNVGQPTSIASNSADVVLTFRNVHSWLGGENPIADQVFAEAFRILKPGGTLGVVEHRLGEEAEDARQLTSGYVKVSTVQRLAEKAGFRLAGSSEVNANSKDSKDYPNGVWTLPPTLQLGENDREKYLAIGESDRMTLKFVKP